MRAVCYRAFCSTLATRAILCYRVLCSILATLAICYRVICGTLAMRAICDHVFYSTLARRALSSNASYVMPRISRHLMEASRAHFAAWAPNYPKAAFSRPRGPILQNAWGRQQPLHLGQLRSLFSVCRLLAPLFEELQIHFSQTLSGHKSYEECADIPIQFRHALHEHLSLPWILTLQSPPSTHNLPLMSFSQVSHYSR